MVAEVLDGLNPRPGGRYADGTLGGAGHAEAMLARSSPTGWLYGCDRDGAALEAARAKLKPFDGRFELRRENFAELAGWIPADSCDGVLLDLGVSSAQLDTAERGFSFQHEGPLDMRMDTRQSLTAADLVNTAGVEELAKIFWQYGDVAGSKRIARAIVQDRERCSFKTTRQLAESMERIAPRAGRRAHPATKVFQALRLVVNDELGSLKRGLEAALKILKPGGRLAVITFHSLEDRAVKEFGRQRARDYSVPGDIDVPELRMPCTPEVRKVNRKAIKPGDAEVMGNPRARSAQLRVMEKI
jgi:16S rRNA (cytosine1402-N4)-methyltransferase